MTRRLTYFVSDVHLGLQVQDPLKRERRFVEFLRGIPAAETEALYLLGDIWDFWYEYKDVVPKGYVRVFAALLDLMDAGVKVYFFPGNHDIWAYSYFRELGMIMLEQPYVTVIGGKRFCLGHGDGLGHHDRKYKIMKAIFTNRLLQWMFSNLLHPNFALWLGSKWSLSRNAYDRSPEFHGEKEWLVEHIREIMPKVNADYYVFGHRHCAIDYQLELNIKYINTGVWFKLSPYAELSDGTLTLKNFDL